MHSYAPRLLRVFFDEECPFCLRVAERICNEATYFPVEVLPMRAAAAKEPTGRIAEFISAGRFVVQDDRDNLYLDTNARLMILYATKRYRSLVYALASPELHRIVDTIFEQLSKNRESLTGVLDPDHSRRLRRRLCKDTGCEA